MNQMLSYAMPFPTISWYDAILEFGIKEVQIDNDIRFEKMSYRNRYYVAGAQGLHLLTIPVENGRNQRIPMKDVKIDNKSNWQKVHWRTLETHYKRAPYFEYIAPMFEHLYQTPFASLVDFNMASMQAVQKLISLPARLQVLEEQIVSSGASTLDIRKSLKPLQAIEGTKNRNYYQVFSDRCGFVSELSVLDYLFNEGIRL